MKRKHLNYFILGLSLATPLASLAQTAKITGLNAPFNLSSGGELTPFQSGDVRINKDLCVYSSTGKYQVKVLDADYNPSAFEINDPPAKSIHYQVFWSNSPGTANQVQLNANQTFSTPFTGASGECPNSGFNANLEVELLGVDIDGARAGSYNTQIEITITPA